jgi:hypothetical protein
MTDVHNGQNVTDVHNGPAGSAVAPADLARLTDIGWQVAIAGKRFGRLIAAASSSPVQRRKAPQPS